MKLERSKIEEIAIEAVNNLMYASALNNGRLYICEFHGDLVITMNHNSNTKVLASIANVFPYYDNSDTASIQYMLECGMSEEECTTEAVKAWDWEGFRESGSYSMAIDNLIYDIIYNSNYDITVV